MASRIAGTHKDVTECTTECRRRFPKLPKSPDMHQWQRWAAMCIAAMLRAKQGKKEAHRLPGNIRHKGCKVAGRGASGPGTVKLIPDRGSLL